MVDIDDGQAEFYLYEKSADGFHPPRRVLGDSEVGRLTADGKRVLVKAPGSEFNCSLIFKGLKDKGGTELGLVISGRWLMHDVTSVCV